MCIPLFCIYRIEPSALTFSRRLIRFMQNRHRDKICVRCSYNSI